MDLQRIRRILEEESIEGWLLYDFQKINPLAHKILEIPENRLFTRRFFYFITQDEPVKIVHRIESTLLDELPGTSILYSSSQELEEVLKKVLKGYRKIAMEYSPNCSLPYISKVDAGTIELVRSCGPTIVSSAGLLQHATSTLTAAQVQTHFYAAKVLQEVVDEAWEYIVAAIKSDQMITEYSIATLMRQKIEERGCTTNHLPIVAVNEHSADPHYIPSEKSSYRIKENDFVLLDLWCKSKELGSIYADICRVGVLAEKPTDKQVQIFNLVYKAQKACIELIFHRLSAHEEITGAEADLAARTVIVDGGYGNYFTHRTGHNIYEEDHGPGAHLDSFETNDTRKLIPNSCFSVEPGIYLPQEFGVRLETDLLIDSSGTPMITGGLQESIKLMSSVC